MRRVFLAGLVGAVLAVTIGGGVASAFPAAPRAKAAVAAPAAQQSPAAPGACLNLDRDNRYLCVGAAAPECNDLHAIVDLAPLVAFYRCGTPTTVGPAPRCINLDNDFHTVCIFGGQPAGSSCHPGILNVKPLIVYYTCPNGRATTPVRTILKRLLP